MEGRRRLRFLPPDSLKDHLVLSSYIERLGGWLLLQTDLLRVDPTSALSVGRSLGEGTILPLLFSSEIRSLLGCSVSPECEWF